MPLEESRAGPGESREGARARLGALEAARGEWTVESGRESDWGEKNQSWSEMRGRRTPSARGWGWGLCSVQCAGAGRCHAPVEGMDMGTPCL